MSLREQAFSAIRWTTLATGWRALLILVQVPILARLLPPEEFGLMATVSAVIAFSQLLADFGVSSVIVDRQERDPAVLSSLYWLNVAVAMALTALLLAGSQPLATFLHKTQLGPVLSLASLSVIAGSFGQQLRIQAERELQFRRVALVELGAAAIGLVVTLGLAYSGAGALALAAGVVTSAAAAAAAYLLFPLRGWRPSFHFRYCEVAPFLRDGAFAAGFGVINTLTVSADVLVASKLYMSHGVGIYGVPRDLALRVATTINPIVTRVGLPVMAQAKANTSLLRAVYLKTMLMTTSVNAPIYLFMAGFSTELVAILLGADWHESAVILQVLALWGVTRSITNPAGSLLFATGRQRVAFLWSIFTLLLSLPLCWMGAIHSIFGLAVAQLSASLVLVGPAWIWLVRPATGITLGEYLAQVMRPVCASLLALGVALFTTNQLSTDAYRLLVGPASFLSSYLLISRWLNSTWLDAMIELISSRSMVAR